jgi:hypothetical protein
LYDLPYESLYSFDIMIWCRMMHEYSEDGEYHLIVLKCNFIFLESAVCEETHLIQTKLELVRPMVHVRVGYILRLSPTTQGICSFAFRTTLCMLGKSSSREGKAGGKLPMEERGEAKLHLLSPRRHLPHVRERGFPRAGRRRRRQRAREKEETASSRRRSTGGR